MYQGSPSTSSNITVQGEIIKNEKKVVRGVEGKELKIVCNIESNIPDIAFVMHIHGSESGRVGSGNLTYSFKPSKNDNMKSFACSAYSIFLEKQLSSKELLDIQYPTVVKIRKEVTGTKVKLTCNPRGNPENYTFADWEHWSEFKEFIRNVQGTPDGKLTLLKPNNSNRLHENDGIYKCKTSNGIEGTNGILYQKGSVVLNNKAPPIFVNANTQIQYGHYGQKMYLNVQLYNNKYDTIRTAIAKQNHPINLPGRQERIITHDRFHGINVTVPGLNITFLLTLGGIEDFADYTITACNYWGCNDFTVKVTSNCRPEPPKYVAVITYARYLEVVWDPGFDGGYQQTFFVEYQQEPENTWKRSVPVIDNRQVRLSTILNNLNPKTRYQVRVLSTNEIGDSKQTAVTSLMTLAESPESPTNVSVIPYDRHLEVSWCPGYNGGDPQTFFIEYQQNTGEKRTRSAPIIDNMQMRMSNILYKMTPNTRYVVRMFSRNEIGESKKTTVIDAMTLDEDVSDNYNPVEEEVRENFQVEPVDNLLYTSSDDSILARAQNIRNQSILDTTVPSTSSDNQFYQMQLLNGGLANGRRSCTYINRGAVSAVLNPQIDDPSLNYSEITFKTAPTMRDAVIHGNVNRTIYSEIDLMAEPVAPLSSSDESDDSDTLPL
ncbi:Hypothetical predicted protein [Mytilus galloprovincialis]|uniref:Uncharacterized protein n=1 Tax=Mytilus galloprovincialis TaxID=29158 RepID=A0A8B6GXY5_MYTGA|nr:Hypothetical predicted protein [Mytilus galloprovincialis]